jgi:hypothetical protein
MNLSEAQLKYLVRDHVIGGAVCNGPINALLAWLTFRTHGVAPMQGDPSILNDVIGTASLMPLMICVIGTPLVRKVVHAGKVEPWIRASAERTMLMWLPANSVLRGLILALAALATVAPMLLGVLLALGVQHMSVGGYVTLKLVYTSILGALVSPLVALYVMATPPVAAIASAAAVNAINE